MSALMAMAILAAGSSGTGVVSASGEGTLTAQGSGTVFVKGTGTLELTGEGSLWYKDLGGDAALTSSKSSSFETDGWKFLSGIGSFKITGTRFVVAALGKNMSLRVQGKGKAHLVGSGTYTAGSRSGSWDDSPNNIPFGKPGMHIQNKSKSKQ